MTRTRPNVPLYRHLPLLLLAATLLSASSARALTFTVVNSADAIPAPVGSLRWAIEKSESNPGPDRIVFSFDGGVIALVAPLPTLADGDLVIGDLSAAGGTPVPAVFIDGGGVITRALLIHSSRNQINRLGFSGIAGAEAVLLEGAVKENSFTACQFGRPDSRNAGAGLRIGSPALGPGPQRTTVQRSTFVGNRIGISSDGPPLGPSVEDSFQLVRANRFGSDGTGGPGRDNLQAASLDGNGPFQVEENLFVGPGAGVSIGPGSARSRIERNRFGHDGPSILPCGFQGAAIDIKGADLVSALENTIECGEQGIRVHGAASSAFLNDNAIGSALFGGMSGSGVVLDTAVRTRVRHNTILGSGAAGVSIDGVDNAANRLSCNSISGGPGPAIAVIGPPSPAPTIVAVAPLAVDLKANDPGPGNLEAFGDSLDQARKYYGYEPTSIATPTVSHPLPVLGLVLKKTAGGTMLEWDIEVPPALTADRTFDGKNSSPLSSPAPSVGGYLYDLIKGKVTSLHSNPNGGVDLGAVVCLANDFNPLLSPAPIDPDSPPPGGAYFYLVRRDINTAARPGSYDPAVCSLDESSFKGPRRVTQGDCAH